MAPHEESRAVQVARAFFTATTKLSVNSEDILPQEDAENKKLSVFYLFSELFPEYAADKDRPDSAGKSGLMRLQFNKIGYEMYEKEQSRRVPAVRAKPGNPGYGFRRARWRETMAPCEDRQVCESILAILGVSQERLERIKRRVHDFKVEWDAVRRPSRPAGPGRPRGHKRATGDAEVPAAFAGMAGQGKKVKKGRGDPPGCASPTGDGLELFGNGPVPLPALVVGSVWDGGVDGAQQQREEEERERRQRASLEDALLRDAGGAAAGGGAGGAGGAPATTAEVDQENASLRSLNISLIHEREALVRQVADWEDDLHDAQRQLDELVHEGMGDAATSAFAAAFAAMASRVASPGAGGKGAELTQQQVEMLQEAIEGYEKQQGRARGRAAGPKGGGGGGQCAGGGHQDGFFELHAADETPHSCEDLRMLLRGGVGGGEFAQVGSAAASSRSTVAPCSSMSSPGPSSPSFIGLPAHLHVGGGGKGGEGGWGGVFEFPGGGHAAHAEPPQQQQQQQHPAVVAGAY